MLWHSCTHQHLFSAMVLFHQRREAKYRATRRSKLCMYVHVYRQIIIPIICIKTFPVIKTCTNLAFNIMECYGNTGLSDKGFTSPCKSSLSASPFPLIISKHFFTSCLAPCGCWSMRVATGRWAKMEVIERWGGGVALESLSLFLSALRPLLWIITFPPEWPWILNPPPDHFHSSQSGDSETTNLRCVFSFYKPRETPAAPSESL